MLASKRRREVHAALKLVFAHRLPLELVELVQALENFRESSAPWHVHVSHVRLAPSGSDARKQIVTFVPSESKEVIHRGGDLPHRAEPQNIQLGTALRQPFLQMLPDTRVVHQVRVLPTDAVDLVGLVLAGGTLAG